MNDTDFEKIERLISEATHDPNAQIPEVAEAIQDEAEETVARIKARLALLENVAEAARNYMRLWGPDPRDALREAFRKLDGEATQDA